MPWARWRAAPRPRRRKAEPMQSLRTLVPFVLVLIAAGSGYLWWHWKKDPLPIGAQARDVEIMPGESLRQVAREFQAQGILVHDWDLIAYARLHEAAGGLRAGEYSIEPGTTVE